MKKGIVKLEKEIYPSTIYIQLCFGTVLSLSLPSTQVLFLFSIRTLYIIHTYENISIKILELALSLKLSFKSFPTRVVCEPAQPGPDQHDNALRLPGATEALSVFTFMQFYWQLAVYTCDLMQGTTLGSAYGSAATDAYKEYSEVRCRCAGDSHSLCERDYSRFKHKKQGKRVARKSCCNNIILKLLRMDTTK